jgi:hypothetical protein
MARRHDRIELNDATNSLEDMRSLICSRFPDNSKDALIKIIRGDKTYADDERLAVLLQSGAVLEYNSTRWVDVHPLVEDWLRSNGMLKPYGLGQ